MDFDTVDGFHDTGYPSPFTAGLFERWRFDLPSILDDHCVSMGDEDLQKVLPVVHEEQGEPADACLNVKEEFVEYEFEPYMESSNSSVGSYEAMLKSAKLRIERACAELNISFGEKNFLVFKFNFVEH